MESYREANPSSCNVSSLLQVTQASPQTQLTKSVDLFQENFQDFSKAAAELTDFYNVSLKLSKERYRQGKISKYMEALDFLRKTREYKFAPVLTMMNHLLATTQTNQLSQQTAVEQIRNRIRSVTPGHPGVNQPQPLPKSSFGISQSASMERMPMNSMVQSGLPFFKQTETARTQQQNTAHHWLKKIKIKESKKRIYDESGLSDIDEVFTSTANTGGMTQMEMANSPHHPGAGLVNANNETTAMTIELAHKLKRTKLGGPLRIEDLDEV